MLSFIRWNVFYSPTLISHFHKLQKCFLSNGTKNMHILAAGRYIWVCHFRRKWEKGMRYVVGWAIYRWAVLI